MAGRRQKICGYEFAGIRVCNSSCLTGPVYLHGLAQLVLQVHSCLGFADVIRVIFIELHGLVWKFAS
jgi:hypothetical protein